VAATGSGLLGVEYSVATVMFRKLNNRVNKKYITQISVVEVLIGLQK